MLFRSGNVLAIMPHPERAQDLGAMCRSIAGEWSERRVQLVAGHEAPGTDDGPGLELFRGLAQHLKGA